MTDLILKMFVRLLLVCSLLSIQACSLVQFKMSVKERDMVDKLLVNPRPVCVGRYILDLPEAFVQDGSMVLINRNYIEAEPMPLPAFEQRIMLREQEIIATKTINKINEPFFRGIHRLPSGMTGVIFERNFD